MLKQKIGIKRRSESSKQPAINKTCHFFSEPIMKFSIVLMCLCAVGTRATIIHSGCQKMSQCLDNANEQHQMCDDMKMQLNKLIIGSRRCAAKEDICGDKLRQMTSEIAKHRQIQSQERKDCMGRRSRNALPVPEQCSSIDIPEVLKMTLPEVDNTTFRQWRPKINEIIKNCMNDFQNIATKCQKMVQCCSEFQSCHLEFELSQVHDDIRQIKLNMLEKELECRIGRYRSLPQSINVDQLVEGEIA